MPAGNLKITLPVLLETAMHYAPARALNGELFPSINKLILQQKFT
jgi:hypothetical protein